MANCIFIIGRPGSGKSSIAQQIYSVLRENNLPVEHLFDYKLLQARFLQEIDKNVRPQERRFRPRGPEELHGFDVIDRAVFDEVLVEMASQIASININTPPNDKKLLLIEFARNSYQRAFSLFGHTLLQDAHILYIDAPFEICMERIRRRLDHHSQYDHFVSDDIMRQYYYRDDWLDGQFQEYLKDLKGLGIRAYHHLIPNAGTIEELNKAADKFVNLHLLSERETETMPAVQDTETIPAVSRVIPQNEPSK